MILWQPEAITDIARLVRHIAEENPVAARRVARALHEAGESLGHFPHRGRPGLIYGTRELVAIYPYIVVYEPVGPDWRVLRVWHGAQDRR